MLTLAIDVASRTIMGFAVLLEPPSVVSVALTLTHAVMSKDAWLADRELEVRWPVQGIPDLLHLDNASEFHSQALERGAEEFGVRLEFRPPGAPHYGGHIERLTGTTMGAVHLLPGTTFSGVAEKGDYSSESAAYLTLLELERWLALQITGVYHQAVHSVLGRPPIVAWQEGVALRRQPPRLPADPETFFLDFLPGETRLIRRDGIQFSHIFYRDNILSHLAGRSPKPVLIKYDPRNIERIYFLDANGRYWPIPYRDLGHPPVSLWEHRQALKQLRAGGRRVVDEKVIFDTILMQRKIVESGRQSTRSRRQEERRNQSKKGNALPTADTSAQPDYSALPPFDVEEWND